MSIELSICLPLKKGEKKPRLVDMQFRKTDKVSDVVNNIVALNNLDTTLRYSLFLERTSTILVDTLAGGDVKDGVCETIILQGRS
jgi:hypothetical protein